MRAFIYKDLPTDTGDFRLVSRRTLDVLKQMRETHRFVRGMVAWLGFPATFVEDIPFHRAPAGTAEVPVAKSGQARAWTGARSRSALCRYASASALACSSRWRALAWRSTHWRQSCPANSSCPAGRRRSSSLASSVARPHQQRHARRIRRSHLRSQRRSTVVRREFEYEERSTTESRGRGGAS